MSSEAAKAAVERMEAMILPDATKILRKIAKKLFPSEIAITDYLAVRSRVQRERAGLA